MAIRTSKDTASDDERAAEPLPLAAVVIAAGQGKRMHSERAKVLHEIGGRALVEHVLAALAPLRPDPAVVVVGHQAERVRQLLGDKVTTVLQKDQLGTGHAVLQAKGALRGFDGDILVLCGDVPLLRAETLMELVEAHRSSDAKATVLSVRVEDPSGYGRIVRGAGEGQLRIVEDADASDEEQHIDEINTGTYCFDAAFLFRELSRLGRENAQREYYLTDLVEVASRRFAATCLMLEDEDEAMGINTRADLARAESVLQDRLIAHWLESGVTFLDPATAFLSAGTIIGAETVIGPYVRLDGTTVIGKGCVFEGASHLRDTRVGDGALLRWGVVADSARIGSEAKIGPFAHLRPEADLGEQVHIGNFVEVKKSRVGARTKANHLAYIGDADVGKDSNLGAGLITCNYDGLDKHRTVIGDRVQIGSDTQLVAPVRLGDDSYIAAGSTITKDVEPGSLAYNDKPQRTRAGWVAGFRARAQGAAKARSGAAPTHGAAKTGGKKKKG
ncbi:MAG: bifunctional UDP-N-acetylglucosamine diphosphorylase/glucosamine-1-phosphate N-acetyltransferase GlmU [Deltaproteobacteria bacterium]|nr:bifunctional UDP-N-acetylglucosamine diphosphorylase/glucosamine-1-phosphate N-acetyltransferase GlmU [Deltaproteobacteria bacterium]